MNRIEKQSSLQIHQAPFILVLGDEMTQLKILEIAARTCDVDVAQEALREKWRILAPDQKLLHLALRVAYRMERKIPFFSPLTDARIRFVSKQLGSTNADDVASREPEIEYLQPIVEYTSSCSGRIGHCHHVYHYRSFEQEKPVPDGPDPTLPYQVLYHLRFSIPVDASELELVGQISGSREAASFPIEVSDEGPLPQPHSRVEAEVVDLVGVPERACPPHPQTSEKPPARRTLPPLPWTAGSASPPVSTRREVLLAHLFRQCSHPPDG